MNVALANRILAGATHNRLVLTIHEARDLLDYLADQPHAAAIPYTGATPIPIAAIPTTILDPDETPDLDYLVDVAEPERTHFASFAEGLLVADDVERLLR